MKAFFSSDQSLKSLRVHAAEWIDTPFAPHASAMGHGVDCVHLVAAIYVSCGAIAEFTAPRYALDSGIHTDKSQLLEWLDNSRRFMRVSDGPFPGDTLCFNLGLSEHHAGLMLDGKQFIHVLPRRRVVVSSLKESHYNRRLTAIYRPVESEAEDVR